MFTTYNCAQLEFENLFRINFVLSFFQMKNPSFKTLKKNFTQTSDKNMATRASIMDLPPETLEMIFKNLHSIKDLASCNNTCTTWKNVIEPMFKNKGN